MEPFALLHLGEEYFEGRWNLPKDPDLAERCFLYAAIYGLEPKNQDEETGGCFITSAVCKSLKKTDDCYELTAFREFRDKWLVNQIDGRRLIKEYYEVAPKIVESIDNTKGCDDIYQDIWDRYLYQCLNYIEKGEYKLCKNLYYKMVGDLKISI